jgi:DSF synthase
MSAVELLAPLAQPRISTQFKADQKALVVTMTKALAGEPQNFSLSLLNDLCELCKSVRDGEGTWLANGALQPINYIVLQSANPEYFSLGGDLAYFRECIESGDKRGLRDYSMSCVDMIYDWASHLGRQTTTISLVKGRALGGGFEAALASDYIIAEEQSEFGFPEILFGLFPCTGGMSLLARRVGVTQAERMMSNGKIYSAKELHAMGVIDEICPEGRGSATVERFMAEHRKHWLARLALQRGRQRLSPLNYEELRTVVNEWVEIAMSLGETDLRVMDMLIKMQRARQPAMAAA